MALTLSTEQAATSKQVASGNHILHRSMRPPDRWRVRREFYRCAHSRMPVLARLHRISTGELGADIELSKGTGGSKPETREGGPTGCYPHPQLERRVLRLPTTPRLQHCFLGLYLLNYNSGAGPNTSDFP